MRRHAEVDSTNRVAADLARGGAPEGVVVVADHQTAGRGRRGRSWQAPAGSSLLVSVLLRSSPPGATAGLATIASALAASDACKDVAGFVPGLKWPNDVVVGERKLGGILAELVDEPGDVMPAVIVGLGLNLRWPGPLPGELAATAVTAEAVAGGPVVRSALLDAYLLRLDHRCDDLATGGGQRTLDDYRRRCLTLGLAVRVHLPGGAMLEGVADDVDDDASLILASAGARHRVTAGDVVHVR